MCVIARSTLGQLIVDEAFAGVSRKQSPLLFPRLITTLCRQQGVMEDENDFFIRGRQGIKPSQIPSLMGFDEDATASAPPSGARTIAAARMAELMTLTERTQDQLRDMQEKMTSLFHYMRERDEAIQSYFQELLLDEMSLFPVFPSELFHAAQPAKRKAPQDQTAPQPPLKKKKVPSTSTATPPVRPPAPEEREEPATPHADTAASVPKPPAKTATASKRTLTRKDKGKAPVRASPRVPAPEATVELDSDDDHDDDMPDAPPPPAPPMEPTIPRRHIKRKANRNISTADLAAEENVASEAEDDGSSTTPEETPNPNPPSSKARYKRVATKQTPKIEKEEMLQHSRKDDEHKDTAALDHPYKRHIKGAEKEGELGRKERKEKVKRDPTIVELQARDLLHLGRDNKLKSTATLLGISFLLFPCIFIFWVVKETKVCWLFCP
ncbi:hypothetical protein GQ457_17G009350 [Hibiscus cannabinus]